MASRLVVVSGPSGSGKSSIVRNLLGRLDIEFSVSATTRSPRPGEIDGRHYHFVNKENFEEMIASGELLEWAEYNGHYYGTPKSGVDRATGEGRDVLLEIEIQGARQIRSHRPDALMFFIVPPSIAELTTRLRTRGDTSPEDIESRLAIATTEIEEAAEVFDHIVVNDILERASDEVANLIIAPDEVTLGSPKSP